MRAANARIFRTRAAGPHWSGGVLAAVLMAAGAPALADAKIGNQTVDCYCTDSGGGRIEMGQTICLQVDGRMFTAQCQMSLNVPMWRELHEGCLASELGPTRPARQDPGPILRLRQVTSRG